ncbi:MAG: hypothetical protein JWQ41_1256 [Variovorax sp.]|nr:hypothetical protein [Variovorax sp.]
MSQSVIRRQIAASSRLTTPQDRSTSDQAPVSRPAFSRTPSVAVANGANVAGVNDKGVLMQEARYFSYLNDTGHARLQAWAAVPQGNHVIDVSRVSELPGWPLHNTMLASRMTNGGVVIRPPYVAGLGYAPSLIVQPSAANAAGIEFKLNGKLLTEQSPMEDIGLAINLVELL